MKNSRLIRNGIAVVIGGTVLCYQLPLFIVNFFELFIFGGIRNMYISSTYVMVFVESALVMLAGILLLVSGFRSTLRWRRYRFYESLLSTRTYMMVEELIKETRYSRARVLKDLRRMIKEELFPWAQIDYLNGCVILDEAVWQEYRDKHKEWLLLREKLQQKKIPKAEYLKYIQAKEQLEDTEKWTNKIQDETMKQYIIKAVDRLDKKMQVIPRRPEMLREYEKDLAFDIPQLYTLTKKYAQLESLDARVKNSDCARELKTILKKIR